MGGLVSVLATDFGIQAASYAVAAPLQTERFYDLSGAATYMTCVATSLLVGRYTHLRNSTSFISFMKNHLHPRQMLVSATTLIWCARLGGFLGYRIMSHGKDDRFDKVKHNPLKFSFYWFMQGVWVFLTAFPVYLINVLPAASLARLGLLDGIGLSLWTTGFLFEAIADYQKLSWQFKLGDEKRKEEFIHHGLWAWSRHPNYFGESLLWAGNFITCASAFRHMGLAKFIGISAGLSLSPLFVYSLLTRVSGVPLLEKKADKKFGQRKDYQEYKAKVPEFFPCPPMLQRNKVE